MNKAFWRFVLGATLAAFGASNVFADGLTVDIEEGECDIVGVHEFEPANSHVAENENWLIGQCHVKLTRDEINDLVGGPIRGAEHFWGFYCSLEVSEGAGEIPSFVSHAVLTPNGNLNVVCVAFPSPG